jgi:RHS repeat-associated protein
MPEVLTAQEYFAFGFAIPNRNYILNKEYRYGFNGKENDNEVKLDSSGNPIPGSEQDYGMRIYDPRVGRFLSVDPLAIKYPELTPYQFASNSPITFIDIDGLEGGIPISYRDAHFDKAVIAIKNELQLRHEQGMNNVAMAEQARQMSINQGRDGDGINWLTKTKLYVASWWFGGGVNSLVPGSSNVEDAKDAGKYFQQGRYGMMTLSAFFALPEIGNISKAFKALSPELRSLIKVTGKIEKAGEVSKELITITRTGKFEDALNVAKGLSGVGDDAVELTGKFGSQEGKVVGFMSADGKRSFRVDYDAEKGAHINWTNGKEKGAVGFTGNQDVVDKMIKNEVPKTLNN